MREHRPEPVEGLRRDARPELRDVALEVGADEILAQQEALVVRACQETVGEAPAEPERLAPSLPAAGLEDVERTHVHVGDATGQALAGLPEQIDGCGAEDKEATVASALAASLVYQSPQRLEQLGHAMDLIEDDEPVLVRA